MPLRRHPLRALTLACSFALSCALAPMAAGAQALRTPAPAVISLVNTPSPGGVFGYWGPDVSRDQAVAARFEVPAGADVHLARIGLWLMNNSSDTHAKLRISLQTDGVNSAGESTPSGQVLAAWYDRVHTLGWVPVEQFYRASSRIKLKAGARYWVVAQSRAAMFEDPVWLYASRGLGFSTTSHGGQWQAGSSAAALALQVDVLVKQP